MRTLIIAAFVLVASLGAPFLVSAEDDTTVISGGTGTTGGIQSGGTGTINPGQGSSPGTNVTLINPLKSGTSLESFLNSILQFVIRIGTVVVILMLVFVGFKFVVAQGSDTKISEARQMLLWTVIGALVLLGAQAISLGIKATVQALSVGG